METTNHSLAVKINELALLYVQTYQENLNHLPVCEKDPDWPSVCEQGSYSDELIYWSPQKITESLVFNNVEEALELTLHPDIKTYFTTLYADHLNVKCEEGRLSLLLPWNKDDFIRLQENMIGHILMKRKLKQTITLFFAITDDDDYILSMNNESGEVWVERVGCEPHKKVANNLAEFIGTLSPDIVS